MTVDPGDTIPIRKANGTWDGDVLAAPLIPGTISGAPVVGEPSAMKLSGTPTEGRFRLLWMGKTSRWLAFDVDVQGVVDELNKMFPHSCVVLEVGPLTAETTLLDFGILFWTASDQFTVDTFAVEDETDGGIESGGMNGTPGVPAGPYAVGQTVIDSDRECAYTLAALDLTIPAFPQPKWAKTWQAVDKRPRAKFNLHLATPLAINSGQSYQAFVPGTGQWQIDQVRDPGIIELTDDGIQFKVSEGGVYTVVMQPIVIPGISGNLEHVDFFCTDFENVTHGGLYPVGAIDEFTTSLDFIVHAISAIDPLFQWSLTPHTSSGQAILNGLTVTIEQIG